MKDREFEQQMEDHKTKSKQSELLDEKGFVFYIAHYAHWVCSWEGEPWLFRWNNALKKWISIKKLTQTEVWGLNKSAIPEQDAEVYHQLYQKNLPSIFN